MGYYDLPWGISSSWYYRHFTGQTWAPFLRVDELVNEPVIDVYLLPFGSNRLLGRNVLDLRVEKSFPIYRGNLKFTIDIYNVFNTGYPLSVEANFNSQFFESRKSFLPRVSSDLGSGISSEPS